MAAALLVLVFSHSAIAQTEQELDEAIKVMKDSGMSQAQIDQIVAAMKMATQFEQAASQRQSMPGKRKPSDRKPNNRKSGNGKPGKQSKPTVIDADPTSPKPGKLVMNVGNEHYQFELGRCNTEQYRTANLIVLAEATATGTFRGVPAVVFMQRSHPAVDVGGNPQQPFESLDIWLTKLSPQQASKPQHLIAQELDDAFARWQQPKFQAIQEQYKVDNSMTVDQMTAMMDRQQEAFDKLEEQAKSRRVAKVRSHGTVDINGKRIVHQSTQALRYANHPKPAPFAKLNHQVSAVASCD